MEEQRMLPGIESKSAVYRKVREEMNGSGGLTIQRMLELGRVSRCSFYRCGGIFPVPTMPECHPILIRLQ
jgi:hypothetical protein